LLFFNITSLLNKKGIGITFSGT